MHVTFSDRSLLVLSVARCPQAASVKILGARKSTASALSLELRVHLDAHVDSATTEKIRRLFPCSRPLFLHS